MIRDIPVIRNICSPSGAADSVITDVDIKHDRGGNLPPARVGHARQEYPGIVSLYTWGILAQEGMSGGEETQ